MGMVTDRPEMASVTHHVAYKQAVYYHVGRVGQIPIMVNVRMPKGA